jgi:two-component system cell cycle sensor histidine kinase/response regulator CckA
MAPMARLERRALVPAMVVLAVVLAAGGLVVAHFNRLDAEARRRAALELARGSAFAIEQQFQQALAGASTLAAMVRAGTTDAQVEAVANRFLELAGGTLSIQLAKDGVISQVWPLAGNESALRFDLVRHPVHGKFVARVIASRTPLLYGPFELVQGGQGFALRVPIFVIEGGRERFWGLASAILRLHALLDESRFPRLARAGFDYAIVREDTPAGGELITSSHASARIDGPSVQIDLPGQRWSLAVAAQPGSGGALGSGALPLAALVIALLAALLAYRVAALPAVLRREVAARTRELQVAHDEQRRAEAAQRQSQRLESIGLLAGGVAHDFNNLLVGILGYADVLASEAAPGSENEEAARTIARAAKRAAELTRQLLAIARLGQHRSEPVDVHAAVREVASLLGRTLDKSVRLETRLAAGAHTVLGDAVQVQQVILNLAVNARDAMPEGGTITLETSVADWTGRDPPGGLARGRYLELAVSDTGPGIPPEIRERIFEPFFTTKPEGKGSGLGLATVFGITKGHGGAVDLETVPGGGARFVVRLPLAEGEAPDAGAEAGAPRGSGVVLVVDDEEVVRRAAGRILGSLGYSTVAVAGGQEAIDWIAARGAPPAAVLLDLSMPGMDGRTCFRRLRALRPELQIVVSSGFSRQGKGEELLAEGAAGFVQKPYTIAELARAIADAAGRGERAHR